MSAVEKKDKKLNIETIKWGKITWLNVEKPTHADMDYLAENYLFNLFDLEDCLSRIERPKIDEYKNYLFLVLHFPVFNEKARVTTPCQVSTFIGEDYLVTVHSGELKPLSKLFDDCQRNERAREEHMARSSGYLLYRILDRLVDYCFPVLNKVIANVEAAEDRLFSEPARDTVQEISVLRRDIMAYRRIIRPQPAILKSLEVREYPFLREDLDVYFGDIGDHVSKISETLDEYKEVVEGLNATSDSLFSHRTNEVMKMLTILGTIILPMLVISGLYGMNVSLPFEGSTFAFLFIILITLGVSGGMLAYFRYKRWI
ncbi:Cobalt/magnesium transport protein CorA [subsurface metagenome]|nr:magnesium transporter CorA family protein [Dehalococcoidia bacterium]MQY55144.1 magnesium transporter [Dehalococcoidia bacterium]